MREEEIYRKLLPAPKLYSLYLKIGTTIKTQIDFYNSEYDRVAANNSIRVLEQAKIISNTGYYSKAEQEYSEQEFYTVLREYLEKIVLSELIILLEGKTEFDELEKRVSISRNCIPLRYAGLLMLLESLESVSEKNNKILFSKKVSDYMSNSSKLSLQKFEEILLYEKQLGEEAEQYVLDFESKKLKDLGIELNPIQVSHIDVSAGYDILSYYSNNADDIKYIEVKSCDDRYRFHLSRNEVEVSRQRGEKYQLYLFNRNNKSIKIIENPYDYYFVNDSSDWVIEVDEYVIHQL